MANYPFCTIEPNVGVVPVPDARLDALVALYHPKSTVSATVNFVDIAGLVRGASKGEGLGNQFLANIRETDAIAHVVRSPLLMMVHPSLPVRTVPEFIAYAKERPDALGMASGGSGSSGSCGTMTMMRHSARGLPNG